MASTPCPAPPGFDPSGFCKREPRGFEHLSAPSAFTAADAQPLAPDLGLWDSWPLQLEGGSTFSRDGARSWFFLPSQKFDDPGQRHFHARIRLMKVKDRLWPDWAISCPVVSRPEKPNGPDPACCMTLAHR